MQNSAIEELYHYQSENIPISQEYKDLTDKQIKLEEILTKKFSKNMLKLYNKIEYLKCGVNYETAKTYFIEGFKMGMRLANESFYDKDLKN